MNVQVMELLEEAKKLSVQERVELADLIYANVPVDPEWEKAWAKEAASRFAAFKRGEIKAYDESEVFGDLDKE
jgi:hypothetical protein